MEPAEYLILRWYDQVLRLLSWMLLEVMNEVSKLRSGQ
jgi:hypothetical protein